MVVYSGFDGSPIWTWNGAAGDLMGWAVEGLGDIDNDGFDDCVVGMPKANGAGPAAMGAARVYSGQTGAQAYQVDGTAAGETLGASLAAIGDLDNDNVTDFIVGSPFGAPIAVAPGSAQVLSGVDGSVFHHRESLPPTAIKPTAMIAMAR